MSGFGASLKRERELRGISIQEIARTTKISTRMLEAIETENFKALPGGVFNRGFIRSYARGIGLNEDDAVNGYLQALREEGAEGIDHLETPPPASASRLPILPLAVLLVAVALVVLIVLSMRGRGGQPQGGARPTAGQSQPTEAPPVESVPVVTTNQFSPMPEPQLQPAPQQQPAPITLSMTFTADTWVWGTADGQPFSQAIYHTGQQQVFTANSELYLEVGNPAGMTYRINGKPGVPLGKPGVPWKGKITLLSLRDFLAPENPAQPKP